MLWRLEKKKLHFFLIKRYFIIEIIKEKNLWDLTLSINGLYFRVKQNNKQMRERVNEGKFTDKYSRVRALGWAFLRVFLDAVPGTLISELC